MNDRMMYRVGIYLRLSDEDRNKFNKDDDSESIKNQRNLLLEEISKRDDFLLVDEYCDEDLSGAGTYRPEFERLIRDCERGKLDVVLCKSQSRFSRDMEIIEKYIHNKFMEWNVRFIGVCDNADTDNMGNKKSRQINGLVNEWYLEDVSNNIRSAFKAKMSQGEFISPFACYGYMIDEMDNNKLVVDREASLIVKDIFNMYLSGLGFMGIAKYLNEKGILSPSYYKYQKGIKLNIVSNKKREDIKWSSTSVKSILKNEIYVGNLIQGKRTTVSYKNHKIRRKNKNEWIRCDNTHEGIIDRDVFDRVQVMIRDRCRGIKNSGKVHLFSGIVKCMECGMGMRKKNSGKYDYLVCSSCSNGYGNCSNRDSIRYDLLEEIVIERINMIVKKYYEKDLLDREIALDKDNSYESMVKVLEDNKLELEDKIKKNDYYLKCLYEDKVNGVISKSQFESLVREYNSDDCRKKIDDLDREIVLYRESMDVGMEIGKVIEFKKLERYIVLEFIKKVCVGCLDRDSACRDIRIEWNF